MRQSKACSVVYMDFVSDGETPSPPPSASVQGLIVTSSAERWRTTEGISGLPSSGKITSAANSAVTLWRKGPDWKSAQVRHSLVTGIWQGVGEGSLCSNFSTSTNVSDASRMATHSPRGKSVLTAGGHLWEGGGCGTAVHSIFKISVDLPAHPSLCCTVFLLSTACLPL